MDYDDRYKITKLSNKQQTLKSSFKKIDPDLASMYEGAIRVLNQKENPDRYAQSAHSFREIMEKIPNYVEVPFKAHKESLKTKVNEIEAEWMITNESYNGDWSGAIDKHLKRFLKKINTFFNWYKDHFKRRRDETVNILRKLDPYNFPLPMSIEEQNAETWEIIRGYFIGITHHKTHNIEEFHKYIEVFENFLIERLIPRTYEDIDEIDRIIEEG